jgi:sugar O-acyltransferase (sialic acid O-acetyltransferase NeuD family)
MSAATPIVILGCGGHGREVYGIIRAINESAPAGEGWRVLGFLDDDPSPIQLARVERLGLPYLGGIDALTELAAEARYVIGIGLPKVRSEVALRPVLEQRAGATLVHPAATIGPEVTLNEGSVVFSGARITTNVVMGRHVHINQNATLAHDCVVEEAVGLNPMAAVSGECVLGREALIGAAAVVLQGLRIGAGAVVGAGACVVRDVAAGAVVKGVPAR